MADQSALRKELETAVNVRHSRPCGIHAMHPKRFGIFVGGIGISGGDGEQDTAVARAALEAFQRTLT